MDLNYECTTTRQRLIPSSTCASSKTYSIFAVYPSIQGGVLHTLVATCHTETKLVATLIAPDIVLVTCSTSPKMQSAASRTRRSTSAPPPSPSPPPSVPSSIPSEGSMALQSARLKSRRARARATRQASFSPCSSSRVGSTPKSPRLSRHPCLVSQRKEGDEACFEISTD